MSLRLVARGAGAAAVVLALVVPAAAQATVAHGYHAYGSCATSAPFAKATRCGIDASQHAKATIVFRSDVGKRDVKVCQRITGLPFKGQQCVKTEKPIASDDIPFGLNGASATFTLHVTIYAKPHGAHHTYRKVATVTLRFSPAA
jgi:hypothetical protein